ncbi:cyclase family protein [Roseomonas haemaphysalidis]|uniref:Cyclase family protein n=1 Tax=Roseomonas haemaphysalidis TaxID=2768162 RepID=A0ABS3KXE3_9PROT|nr:cyclase family protein [Roseomonas haemaphysalidis]MBO1081318.1 cyclase family protein [Roseomonas haemaphysalidis]
MAREAWGRWGAADEAGAPNRIGREQVRLAASLVRTGQVVSLAQPLSPASPVPKHRAGMQHFMGRDGGDYAAGAKRPGGFQFAEDTVVLPLHLGTHMDALCHAWCDDHLYNGFLGSTVRSTTRALRCGAEKLPPVTTRGLLLDVVALRGGPLPGDASIGREALQAACARIGATPGEGDAVLIRTGWQEAQQPGAEVDFTREPGIDVEAAEWLADSGVALVGADNYAIEVLPFPPGTVFPVHQRLIRDYGVPLLEGMVLKPLAEAGGGVFLFVAAALPLVGATGSPVNPLAVL